MDNNSISKPHIKPLTALHNSCDQVFYLAAFSYNLSGQKAGGKPANEANSPSEGKY